MTLVRPVCLQTQPGGQAGDQAETQTDREGSGMRTFPIHSPAARQALKGAYCWHK